ncbi:MAG TPA: hypothetical protein VGF75_06320 [Candidatus Saccharimonadales bacterium]
MSAAIAFFLGAFNVSVTAENELSLVGSFGGAVGAPGETAGISWSVGSSSTVMQGLKNGFFGHGASNQLTINGDLTAVTDANIRTVMQNLLNALQAYGLIIDGTT